jgi:hypothetical protein
MKLGQAAKTPKEKSDVSYLKQDIATAKRLGKNAQAAVLIKKLEALDASQQGS